MACHRKATPAGLLAATLAATLCGTAHGVEVDASCAPVFKTMQAEMSVQSFHKWSEFEAGGRKTRMEIIKSGGILYSRNGEGPWSRLPISAAEIDKQNAAALRDGKSKISGCRRVGLDTVDGTPTTVFEYTAAAGGDLPPTKARAWIGVADNLPYRFESAGVTQKTVYKGVTAPKL
jgi:hypothetical protein